MVLVPAASEAAVPPEEPPGVHSGFQGFRGGFFTTVIFYTFGNIKPGTSNNSIYESLSYLGNLPGDPFERLVPFILSCFVIFLYSKKSV